MIYSPISSIMFFIFLQFFNSFFGFQKNIEISENNIVSVELARALWYWREISVKNRQKKIALLLTFILEHAHVKADQSN
jgi:hypothetical protein